MSDSEDLDDDLPESDLPESDLSEEGATLLSAEIGPDMVGDRLDRVLAAAFSDLSRARLQVLISEGRLSFEGETIRDGKHKARPGRYELSV
ncbi:MAG TPA: RluA family pseudouridine synthase, partial [Asticcacaulis sp.]|nr:RluA family pseudouridine synthase [Asticcacaulis sp.]